MRTKLIVFALLCADLGISGCTTTPTQEQTGMVMGGVLGGALGSQIGGGSGSTVAAIAGALLGATVGSHVGRSMDDTDRIKVARVLETERTGTPSQWSNPDTGNHYTVVPTRTYETAGMPCREFTVNSTIGGKKEKIYGTACRQADGSWRTVNSLD
jgi:surface antigen